MPRISLVAEAHRVISEILHPGNIVIDASCGNGHDTLFLAQQVGKTGKVFGFDIQRQALEATAKKLRAQQHSQVKLVEVGHENMAIFIPDKYHQNISAIMFNLGYLPGSNKAIITQTETTLIAFKAACFLLKPKGIITVIAYPGHDGGLQELNALKGQMSALNSSVFQAQVFTIDKDDLSKPQLFIISKKPI